ncbi:hypothetical protein SAMN04490197_0659 [Pseudomonas orientalis]|uniref:Uncharacterized protein n=1 Tax=Pseudomonas orientalis TaxID=76758 RepID=A0A8B3XUV2_9PSED|nr:hypothetical protein SAMN04490197_0659 [Pseudomonas orientalis]
MVQEFRRARVEGDDVQGRRCPVAAWQPTDIQLIHLGPNVGGGLAPDGGFRIGQNIGSDEYISVSAVTASGGSALTAGHFWRDPKVTKRSSPHHSAPRPGSVCPLSGLNPWAAAMGHPWPSAANPASCRVTHEFKPAFGQRGLTGRLRSRSKARSRATRFASWLPGTAVCGLCSDA